MTDPKQIASEMLRPILLGFLITAVLVLLGALALEPTLRSRSPLGSASDCSSAVASASSGGPRSRSD